MQTYVIASEEDFDERGLNLLDIHDAERVDPVFTDDTCVNGTKGETGCFRAHKNVWGMCAAQDSADRCLVLERDWTIGDQDPAHVASELQSLPTSNDYYLVGNCGYAWCSHAYVITKEYAAELSDVDECALDMPVDAFINKKCREGLSVTDECVLDMPIDAFTHQRCRNGSSVCGLYEKEKMPGCFGNGLIQQNRKDMIGMHDENNKMRELREDDDTL